MPDLRSYLQAVSGTVFRPRGAFSVAHEITALQYALEAVQAHPIVVVDRPTLLDGSASEFGVVCNLTASRALTARALRVADHRQAAGLLAERIAHPVAPVVVDRAAAPVQELVLSGEAVDLTRLPALRQHALDPGPYLTAAHATTFDPDTGIDNTAIQRCWLRAPRRMSYFPYPASHNARNMRKFWAKGEPCPVAFWIGHHPAVSIGAQAKLGYPESHWGAAGALLGTPVRLVPTITHGARILVPADAEIVVEGYVPPDRFEADGPFGEYAGYMGPQTLAPVCEVACITRRRDALYHDYGSGLRDMLVPDNLMMEARLYDLVRVVAPALTNVHVPVSGRRFHAYLQLESPMAGEARDALTAALAYRRLKAAIALDDDVDIFSEAEVLWALATRVQWQRDTIALAGLSGSALDVSWGPDQRTTEKIGIDATLPAAPQPGAPKPVAPRSTVPASALARARTLLAGQDRTNWPTA